MPYRWAEVGQNIFWREAGRVILVIWLDWNRDKHVVASSTSKGVVVYRASYSRVRRTVEGAVFRKWHHIDPVTFGKSLYFDCLVLWMRRKTEIPCTRVSMPGQAKDPTQGVNV
jgi:hypothetical protein